MTTSKKTASAIYFNILNDFLSCFSFVCSLQFEVFKLFDWSIDVLFTIYTTFSPGRWKPNDEESIGNMILQDIA